jgi:hypothetical protein
MQRADDILAGDSENDNMEDPQTQPTTMPSVGPKPGWQTSEGQMTGIFVVVSFLFSYFGHTVTTDQLQNGYSMILDAIQHIGPILAAAGVLWNYITSRGKMKSNAINSTASMAVGFASPIGGKWGKILDIGKAIAPALPGPAGAIAGSILGDDVSNDQVTELVTVAKNHEGRIRTLEKK